MNYLILLCLLFGGSPLAAAQTANRDPTHYGVTGMYRAWPMLHVLQHECDDLMTRRQETGFACGIVDDGATFRILVRDWFAHDEAKKKQAKHDRLALVARFIAGGG